MGIIGGCVGLYTFKGLKNTIGKYPAVGVAAWLATVVAAAAAAVELAIAGTFPLTFRNLLNGIIPCVYRNYRSCFNCNCNNGFRKIQTGFTYVEQTITRGKINES